MAQKLLTGAPWLNVLSGDYQYRVTMGTSVTITLEQEIGDLGYETLSTDTVWTTDESGVISIGGCNLRSTITAGTGTLWLSKISYEK